MVSALMAAGAAFWTLGQQESRPNIIFLMSDDQRDGTFSGMGHPWVRTPNVDRLLNQSVRFQNTYIAEPICAPSRVSFLTGLYERVHGIGFTSSYKLTEDQWRQTYPALLQENGYHTGFVGKFGVQYYTFRGNASEKFDYWWGHDDWTKFFPKDHDSASTRPYHRAKNNIITPIMGEAMTEFLESTPRDKPFCLSVSFNVPHGSQTRSMYEGFPNSADMGRPANENDKLKGTEFYDLLYRSLDLEIPEDTESDPYRFIPKSVMNQRDGRIRTYRYNYTRQSVKEHHIRYYQTISGMDHVIGGLVDDLKRLGMHDNTVIIFGSDHGLLMGEYGMGGKALLYDLTTKIPCFVYDPRLAEEKQGRVLDQLVSSLDVPSTILDYAGVDGLQFAGGMSLKPLVEGRDSEWRDEVFLESLYTGRGTPIQEGVRRGDWKYIRMFKVSGSYDEEDVDFRDREPVFEMLFNLADDPGERTNLIGKDETSEITRQLRARCAALSAQLNAKREEYKQQVSVEKR